MARTKCGVGNKIEVLTDANGLPLAVLVVSANTHETRMGLAVAARTLALLPRRVQTPVLADKAYDDERLREQLERLGLVPVAKHRCNRVRPAT